MSNLSRTLSARGNRERKNKMQHIEKEENSHKKSLYKTAGMADRGVARAENIYGCRLSIVDLTDVGF